MLALSEPDPNSRARASGGFAHPHTRLNPAWRSRDLRLCWWEMSLAEESLLPGQFREWFTSRGWQPRAHQLELLEKARSGHSVLLVAPTGAGKTLAGFLPSLVELSESRSAQKARKAASLHTLYISPLKALATDVARNLETPVREMGSARPYRDANRRYATPQARPSDREAARHPADDARTARPAARAPGRAGAVCRSCAGSSSTNSIPW